MLYKLLLGLAFVAVTFASNSSIGQRTAGDSLLHKGTVDVPFNPAGRVTQSYHYRDVSFELEFVRFHRYMH